jgi:hypothetical protein
MLERILLDVFRDLVETTPSFSLILPPRDLTPLIR